MVLEVRQHQDFEQLLERSKTNPVLIFKHSTQCSISAQAYEEFQRFAGKANELTCGIVLVIEFRDISYAIASELGMEHESFENEPIAQLMNDNFVNIKVDREERPDIDQIYMSAVQMMTGSGGWPLTVFLLPNGQPFFGGTYFPPDDAYGRPGFRRVLETM